MKKIIIILLTLFPVQLISQKPLITDSVRKDLSREVNVKSLILPATLLTYGIFSIENHYLKYNDSQLRNEVQENIDEKITIDDFTQYAPAASVYVLNGAGFPGRHNFRDRSVILGTSYLIMASTVRGLKSITRVARPDGSAYNSFPSGHTATAFCGAEFLWQEYREQSIWYGIAGYAVATGTGLFRIYNDRHWLSDVAMGAGMGIVSTKISYWIVPYLTQKSRNVHHNTSSVIVPYYTGKEFGAGMIMSFDSHTANHRH